jgi:hypothetical protein
LHKALFVDRLQQLRHQPRHETGEAL